VTAQSRGVILGRRIGAHTGISIAGQEERQEAQGAGEGQADAPGSATSSNASIPASPQLTAPLFASKNLYNAANYVVRQSFINEGVYLPYQEMHRRMQEHEAYKALPAKVAQWVLLLLDKNWQSYFAALAAWQADSSTFVGHPKLPGYKENLQGRNLLVYTIQARSVPALRAGMIVPSMLGITVKTKQQTVQQVRSIPRIGFYLMEVVYEREPVMALVNPALHVGIDIGLTETGFSPPQAAGFQPRR
jgi:putative transposase